MPHSSGGGSSGGGFHGGSSSGSSNHISTHYFPGARRYRRYYSDGRPDEYIYANSKPARTSLAAVVIIAVMAFIFIGASGAAVFSDRPKFITPKYSDAPAIHDKLCVIDNNAELLEEMKKFNDETGICPVVYTVFAEEWNRKYEDLEKYAYDVYVNNFKDEQHFVIVYSVTVSQLEKMKDGSSTKPEFMWEAIQGNETDPIITKSVFLRIGNVIQDELMAGKGAGEALTAGFKKANTEAENLLNPSSPKRIFKLITSSLPVIFVTAIFVPMLILVIKSYKKDQAMSIEEVPLDVEPSAMTGVRSFINAKGGVVTTYQGPGFKERSVQYDASNAAASKVISIFSIIFLIPFVLVGIGVTAGGAVMLNAVNGDRNGGIFMIIFGIIWTVVSLSALISLLRVSARAKKNAQDPLTAEYPKAEYPDMKPVTPASARPTEQTEFDPQFFGPAKSDYESDDDDYKRMKRKGFE